MNLKRISALVLALAMTASVTAFAAESETPDVVVDESVVREVNHDQGDISLLAAPAGGGFGPGFGGLAIPINVPRNYAASITVNGEALEEYSFEKYIDGSWQTKTVTIRLADLPAVEAGYVPMRAVASADPNCYVDWFEESNKGRIVMIPYTIMVSFDDMSVTVDDELVEGMKAILLDGTTFLPVSIFDYLEGYDVVDTSADGVESYVITTPYGNRSEAEVLAEKLKETANMGMGWAQTAEELEELWSESHGFSADYVTEDFIAYLPAMISPDTLIVGKIAEGQEEALKAVLDSYYEAMAETWITAYAGSQYYKVENTTYVTEGDWFLFLMGENPDEVVAQFRAEVQAMDAGANGGIMPLPMMPML